MLEIFAREGKQPSYQKTDHTRQIKAERARNHANHNAGDTPEPPASSRAGGTCVCDEVSVLRCRLFVLLVDLFFSDPFFC